MFRLAKESMKAGGIAPAVFNAANEVAVEAFLGRRIPFLAIPRIVSQALDRTANFEPADVGSVLGADKEARRGAERDVDDLK
jgi:1-deoxy-D-xylulose-5-phosphate reductoisomerase